MSQGIVVMVYAGCPRIPAAEKMVVSWVKIVLIVRQTAENVTERTVLEIWSVNQGFAAMRCAEVVVRTAETGTVIPGRIILFVQGTVGCLMVKIAPSIQNANHGFAAMRCAEVVVRTAGMGTVMLVRPHFHAPWIVKLVMETVTMEDIRVQEDLGAVVSHL